MQGGSPRGPFAAGKRGFPEPLSTPLAGSDHVNNCKRDSSKVLRDDTINVGPSPVPRQSSKLKE